MLSKRGDIINRRSTSARRSACSGTLSVLASLLVAVAMLAAPQHASASHTGAHEAEEHLTALTNELRAARGLSPLEFDQGLYDVAASWAAELSTRTKLAHNPNADAQIDQKWWTWGENVGWGWSTDWIHDAWVKSRTHRLNLVDRYFTHQAVAAVLGPDGWITVVHVFAG